MKTNINILSLWLCGLSGTLLLTIYLLLGKLMAFPLKIGYAVVSLVLLLLIFYNIFAIIKKNKKKNL